MNAAGHKRDRLIRLGIPLLLIGVVAFVFHDVLRNGFVSWDDQFYVTNNPHIRIAGWQDVFWFFTHSYYWAYIPLTMLSHAADVALFGMEPAGHHLVNLIIHAVNAVLFFFLSVTVARRWTGRQTPGPAPEGGENARAAWVGAFAALIFALHPLRVESVAWVSDRKDLLCTLFLMLAMMSWLRAEAGEGRTRVSWVLLTCVFHLAALLSKATALMFPVVLVALDLFSGPASVLPRLIGSVRKALPFILLSAVAGAIGMASVPTVTINFLAMDLSPLQRALLPFHSVLQPLAKFAWPASLSPVYDYPPAAVMGLSALLVLLVSAGAVIWWWLGHRGPLAAWSVYLILSTPTALFFTSGIQPIADRYTYLSMLPLTMLLAAALAGREGPFPFRGVLSFRSAAVPVLLALGLILWSARSASQIGVWRSSLSLWQHAALLTPGIPDVQNNLGEALMQEGYVDEAVVAYSVATEMRPDFADAFNNLGVAHFTKRDYRRGIESFLRAEDLFRKGAVAEGSIADVQLNLAAAYWEIGDTSMALRSFRSVLTERESSAEAHAGIGNIMLSGGDTLAAVRSLRRAAELGDTASVGLLNRVAGRE
jgi:Tfp pilus assembly protein PilF